MTDEAPDLPRAAIATPAILATAHGPGSSLGFVSTLTFPDCPTHKHGTMQPTAMTALTLSDRSAGWGEHRSVILFLRRWYRHPWACVGSGAGPSWSGA